VGAAPRRLGAKSLHGRKARRQGEGRVGGVRCHCERNRPDARGEQPLRPGQLNHSKNHERGYDPAALAPRKCRVSRKPETYLHHRHRDNKKSHCFPGIKGGGGLISAGTGTIRLGAEAKKRKMVRRQAPNKVPEGHATRQGGHEVKANIN